MTRTWFVTGASRGMGRELVGQLLANGERVAATARRPDQLADLAASYPHRLWVGALDVTDTSSIRCVVEEAFAEHPRIDVVVSNAGYGVFGVAEDLDDRQIDQLIATNLTGSIQLARAVIPALRAQGGGLLVQMSSMGGQLSFPAFSMYHATNWGIEGFYESLAAEVGPFGIKTMLVEPGIVGTGFFDAAARVPVSEPYRGGPGDQGPIPVERMACDRGNTVRAIIEATKLADPPSRLVLGSDAWGLMTEALGERLRLIESQRISASAADVAAGR